MLSGVGEILELDFLNQLSDRSNKNKDLIMFRGLVAFRLKVEFAYYLMVSNLEVCHFVYTAINGYFALFVYKNNIVLTCPFREGWLGFWVRGQINQMDRGSVRSRGGGQWGNI